MDALFAVICTYILTQADTSHADPSKSREHSLTCLLRIQHPLRAHATLCRLWSPARTWPPAARCIPIACYCRKGQ